MDAAELLERALEERGLPRRAFARLLAGEGAEPKEVDRWRRAIYRVLDGKITPPLADAMEAALELPAGYFPRRPVEAGALTRGQLTSGLRELEETVESLEKLVKKVERRVAALERPPSHGASESA